MLQENTKNQISVLEASKNFSKLTKMVDKDGLVVILENEKPKYILLDYSSLQKNRIAEMADLQTAAKLILQKHRKAFEELAK